MEEKIKEITIINGLVRRRRLDVLLVKAGLVESRNKAQDLIKSGNIKVDGKVVTKMSQSVPENAGLEIIEKMPFVGRSGLKMRQALDDFKIDVKGKKCVDVGASTGGFTDCLLQRGAKKVYSVDVGTGQLADKLLDDKRVVSLEGTDIRTLKTLSEKMDLAGVDVSFISLKKILPELQRFLKKTGEAVILIKPEFEGGKGAVDRHGVITDPKKRKMIVKNLIEWINENGWQVVGGPIESVTKGEKGNVEYLAYIKLKYR